MQPIIFVDLDDTLFQTDRKIREPGIKFPAAISKDGKPLCFMTAKQQHFFQWLSCSTILIPTTARNYDAFSRVQLSFHSYVILNFGATILSPNRELDSKWDEIIRPKLQYAQAELNELYHELQALIRLNQWQVSLRLIKEFDVDLYLVAKDPFTDGQTLPPLDEHLRTKTQFQNCKLQRNDNNISIVPNALNKAHAVRHLLQELRGQYSFSLGIGDSLSDLPFLKACDFGIFPQHSQIVDHLPVG